LGQNLRCRSAPGVIDSEWINDKLPDDDILIPMQNSDGFASMEEIDDMKNKPMSLDKGPWTELSYTDFTPSTSQ